MADIQHAAIVDPYIHEPKGIASAGNGTVYISNGSGTGAWTVIPVTSLNYTQLLAELQSDVNDSTLDLNGRYWLFARLTDISTASSVIIPVIRNSTVISARAVLGGAITTANATVNFLNSSGAAMGTPVTVVFTGSAKGNGYTFTATGNNVITGPSWIEVTTDGASDTVQPLSVLIELSTILNP